MRKNFQLFTFYRISDTQWNEMQKLYTSCHRFVFFIFPSLKYSNSQSLANCRTIYIECSLHASEEFSNLWIFLSREFFNQLLQIFLMRSKSFELPVENQIFCLVLLLSSSELNLQTKNIEQFCWTVSTVVIEMVAK